MGLYRNHWESLGVIEIPTNVGKLIYCQKGERPRAALFFSRRVVFHPLHEFITIDLVSAIVDIPISGGSRKVVVASAYFAHDKNVAPNEFVKLVKYCKSKNLQLLISIK